MNQEQQRFMTPEFQQMLRSKETFALSLRILEALEKDKTEGYDLECGLFGTAFSGLVVDLAYGAPEPLVRGLQDLLRNLKQDVQVNGSGLFAPYVAQVEALLAKYVPSS